MVKGCSVVGCTNRSNDAKRKGVRFFKFPQGVHKRRSWIRSLNRKDWVPTKNSFVCSDHFIHGWHSDDIEDVNYTPTLIRYKIKTLTTTDTKRSSRNFRRDLTKTFEEAAQKQKEREEGMLSISVSHHDYVGGGDASRIPKYEQQCTSIGVQCDEDPLLEDNNRLLEENRKQKEQVNQLKWSVEKIKGDDKATKFYTGFRTYTLFLWLYNFLLPKAQNMKYWVGQSTTEDKQIKTSQINTTFD